MVDEHGKHVSIVVEGDIDEIVLSRIVWSHGGEIAQVYGKRGKSYIEKNIASFAQAAAHRPWAVMVDLDGEGCAPEYLSKLGVLDHPDLCSRVAVREVEAWLMADRAGLAQFLSVARTRVPDDPEALHNPKEALVNVARGSRSSNLVRDIVPTVKGGRSVGVGYSERMMTFALDNWDLDAAMQSSPSLSRAHTAIGDLLA